MKVEVGSVGSLGTDKLVEKWVKNLSSVLFTKGQESLLTHGPNSTIPQYIHYMLKEPKETDLTAGSQAFLHPQV